MNEETKKCPKCGGEMERGILLDRSYWGTMASCWAKSWKSIGTLAQMFGGAGKKSKTIISYRCQNCGYIENYAQ